VAFGEAYPVRRLIRWSLVASLAATPVLGQIVPGAVSGTVRDEAGRTLENALVVLDATSARRLTRADSTGRFRFDRVSRGTHELTVAWIAYRTDVRTIQVTDAGLDVEIVLHRNTAQLDTVHVQAQRTGVSGVVFAHTDHLPLGGAEVALIGSGASAKTDAQGRFDLRLVRRGTYVLYVKRRGYLARMLSVIVPKDSAVELALAMDEGAGGSGNRLAIPLDEFDHRAKWMIGGHAAIVPRQELAAYQGLTLWDALQHSMSYLMKGFRLDDAHCIYVDGVFKPAMTAQDYVVSDIEAVEVFGTGADFTGTVTYANGKRPTRLPVGGQCGNAQVPLSLSTRRTVGMAPPRAPAERVEAIVIWLKR
jgi:hypothetical protein